MNYEIRYVVNGEELSAGPFPDHENADRIAKMMLKDDRVERAVVVGPDGIEHAVV